MATASVIVLWLTPAEPARSWLRETIRRLALEHDAPIFEPHLTLGLGSAAQLRQLDAAALDLPIVGVDCSKQFTKTLFLRFELSRALAQVRRSLGMEFAGFDPHLSLLYRKLPSATKSRLAESLSLLFPSVTFSAIEAIRCPAEVASRADVESWEKLAARALA